MSYNSKYSVAFSSSHLTGELREVTGKGISSTLDFWDFLQLCEMLTIYKALW